MTRKQIRDMARKKLGETTASFWSDTELNTWMDHGGDDVARKTKSIKTTGYITTELDTYEYTISSSLPNYVAISELYLYQGGDNWEKLTCSSREEMDLRHPGWMSVDSGVPMEYFTDNEEDKLYLYLPPDSDNAGSNYLKAIYARTYSPITNDNDSPNLPVFLHMTLVHYLTALGYESRGFGDKANDSWQKYYGRISEYYMERARAKEDEEIIMKPEQNLR